MEKKRDRMRSKRRKSLLGMHIFYVEKYRNWGN